jgi:predicted RNase H-like nuclease (RuvC/YqgF family)
VASAAGGLQGDGMRKAILAALLASSIALNVLIVAVGSVSAVASKVFEGLTGIASVVSTLQDQVMDLKAQVDASRAEVDTKDRKLAELNAELNGKSDRIDLLEADIERAHAEVGSKESKIKNLEVDLKSKSERVQLLEGEVESLRPREVSYRGKTSSLGEAVEDTTERVSRRTALGTSRNVAATFGESVPMVGIAVVVGATAWEIKDACDTMKDLHELEVALDPTRANDASVKEVCGMAVPTKEELWEKVKSSPGEAWQKAKIAMPDLPEMPDLPDPLLWLLEIDWKFWD